MIVVMMDAGCCGDCGNVFIDANGLRSYNAVEQQQNEGRNSVFS